MKTRDDILREYYRITAPYSMPKLTTSTTGTGLALIPASWTKTVILDQKKFKFIALSDCRVVYGGGHTVLLDKISGKRLCHVQRDEQDENSLPRAVLYLVLKFKGIGGSVIQEWSSQFMQYAQLKMKREFEIEFMKWLLEFGAKPHYTRTEAEDIMNRIYYREGNGNCFDAFLYFLCEDRFSIKAEEISNLIFYATCSEKKTLEDDEIAILYADDKEFIRIKKLADKEVNSFNLEVNKILSDEPEERSRKSKRVKK